MKKTYIMTPLRLALLGFAAPLLFTGCGGGGGGGSGSGGGSSVPPPPPPTPGGKVAPWQSGVYEAASTFKDKCVAMRTGVDSEGNAYTDTPGTVLHETNWLRSWTQETYLWNTEVADLNPALYPAPVDYFGLLRTLRLTPSGRFKDEFHFSEPTADYLAYRNSEPAASYGMALAISSPYVPRDVRVVYTEPNSPAAAAGIKRGTRILAVNGVDVVYGGNTDTEIDTLNTGLFPPQASHTNSFRIQDPDGTERTLSLTSANLTDKPVNRTRVIDTATGKVGYILFNTFSPFSSEYEIATAMQEMKSQNISDLVLDLRYNGGGLLAVASQLGYMVAGDTATSGKTFEARKFNARAGNLDPITGEANKPVPFFKTGLGFSLASGTSLPSLNLPRVFVLTTGSTCSASEAVINSLRGIDVEVIQIGDTTCGKPYGFYPQDNCGQTYYTIQFQGVNHKGFGDYADGFVPQNASAAHGVRLPGCYAEDSLATELGEADESLLSVALAYRSTGNCPSGFTGSGQSRMARASATPLGKAYASSPALKPPSRSIMNLNRDMTMPAR